MKTNRRGGERGTQMVELAIVLPLLVLVTLVTIEGAVMARTHQVMNNAAREGARVSALEESRDQTADIVDAVVAYANTNGVPINAGDVTITQNALIPGPNGVGMRATIVTVTYAYTVQYVPAFTELGLPGTYNLTTNAEFRTFY